MTCDNCETMCKVRRLLATCEKCDNGSHHGASHVQATDYTLSKRKVDNFAQTPGVTHLNPDDEDALRKAMSNLFALDPINLLMIQFVVNNPNGSNFADFLPMLQGLDKRIRRYKKSGARSMAHAMKESIITKMPMIAPLFRHAVDPKSC